MQLLFGGSVAKAGAMVPESFLSNAVSIKLRLVNWIELILELLVTSVVECSCCCCCFTG